MEAYITKWTLTNKMHNVHRVVTRIQGEIVFLTHTVKAVNTICHPLNPLVVVLIERIHTHICTPDTEVRFIPF